MRVYGKQVVPVEAASLVKPGEELPVRGNDTVYFCTVDGCNRCPSLTA